MAKKPSPRKTAQVSKGAADNTVVPEWHQHFNSKDTRHTVETVEDIIAGLLDGRSMRDICSGKNMPDRETVARWCEKWPDLAAAIARAREDGFMERAERAVIAAKTAEDAQKGRLAFDAERWFLGKVSKALGDKTVIAGDKDNPLRTEVKHDLSDAPEEVLRYLADKGRSEG